MSLVGPLIVDLTALAASVNSFGSGSAPMKSPSNNALEMSPNMAPPAPTRRSNPHALTSLALVPFGSPNASRLSLPSRLERSTLNSREKPRVSISAGVEPMTSASISCIQFSTSSQSSPPSCEAMMPNMRAISIGATP